MEQPLFLLKRTNPDYIDSVFNEGKLFFNTPDYFRKCDDPGAADFEECADFREFIGESEITISEAGKPIGDKPAGIFQAINARFISINPVPGNLISFAAVNYSELHSAGDKLTIDISDFGESLIFIQDVQEFLIRIERQVSKMGLNADFRSVKYYKNGYSGHLDYFSKHENYKDQKEFRIFIPNDIGKAFTVDIGSLHDIASVHNGDMTFTLEFKDRSHLDLHLPYPAPIV